MYAEARSGSISQNILGKPLCNRFSVYVPFRVKFLVGCDFDCRQRVFDRRRSDWNALLTLVFSGRDQLSLPLVPNILHLSDARAIVASVD